MIHPTAIVSPKAKIGKNVSIGAYTVIYDNVEIKDNTVVGGYCSIGESNHLSDGKNLIIGKNSHIRSYSIFYEGSVFGEQLITGHRVTVREKTVAGKNLQIGTLTDIQGHCDIGDYVRLHSNVHIGQKSCIGNYVWIFPYTVLTNDPHPPSDVMLGVSVEDYAVIATGSIVLPGVTIGTHCLIGASSMVNRDAEPRMIYSGNPATKVAPIEKIKLRDDSGNNAYPWIQHFHRGYPEHVVEEWKRLSVFDDKKKEV